MQQQLLETNHIHHRTCVKTSNFSGDGEEEGEDPLELEFGLRRVSERR